MSDQKKYAIIAGSCVAALLIFTVSFPYLSGHWLRAKLPAMMERYAAAYDLDVVKLEVTGEGNQTIFNTTLAGVVSDANIHVITTLESVVTHQPLWKLATPLTASSRLNNRVASRFDATAQLESRVHWNGSLSTDFKTDAIHWDLNAGQGDALMLKPMSGTVTVDRIINPSKIESRIEQIEWILTRWYDPAMVWRADHVQSMTDWRKGTQLTFDSVHVNNANVTAMIEDVALHSKSDVDNAAINASLQFNTGRWLMNNFANLPHSNAIQSVRFSSSLKDLSLNVIQRFEHMMQNTQNSEGLATLVELTQELHTLTPSWFLDELAITTQRGTFTMSGGLAANQTVRNHFGRIKQEPLTLLSGQFLWLMDSELTLSATDDFLRWSCEAGAARMTDASASRQMMYNNMCTSVVESGNFLDFGCAQLDNEAQQAQCMVAVQGIKKQWQQNKSLTLKHQDGELTLNDVPVSDFLLIL